MDRWLRPRSPMLRRPLVGMCAVAVLALAACGGNSSPAATEESEDPPKVAILTSVGLQDSGLGRVVVEGAELIEKNNPGVEIEPMGSIEISTWADTLRQFGAQGYDLVITQASSAQNPVLEVAPEFPDTFFVVLNGFKSAAPNVAGVDYEWEEGGMLAGIAAGVATKTGVVAGVGADEIPPIQGLMNGFTEGVAMVNPSAQVSVSYTGLAVGDPIKAREQALAQVGRSADVIFGVANNGQPGVFQAAADSNIFGIGFGVDENDLAPESVITSTMLDYAGSMNRAFDRFQNGELKAEVYVEGFDDGVWKLADFHGLLPEDQVTRIETEVEKVMAGAN